MEKQPVVSICCVTFNHEAYIAKAIDSFLMQKTTFPYEILVHDDASTDRTPEILRAYEARFPELLKVIYQTENQYSQGRHVSQFILEQASGKYIAVCEGDDFWTDPEKLQRQVEHMEGNPGTTLCVHAASHVDNTGRTLESRVRPSSRSRYFSAEEVIEGGGGLFPTNSYLYPVRYATERPDYYYRAHIGDYPLAIYLATEGDVYYIDRPMSAYRVGVAGSWTARLLSSPKKLSDHFQKTELLLDAVNEANGHRYEAAIDRTKRRNRFQILLQEERFEEVTSPAWRDCFARLSAADQAKIRLKLWFPAGVDLFRKVRRKWSR